MNYKKIHDLIIGRGKARGVPVNHRYGYHIHHIIAKCQFPQGIARSVINAKDNLVYLTYKEHYIIHHLLAKIYPMVVGLVTAHMMNVTHNHTARGYAYQWRESLFAGYHEIPEEFKPDRMVSLRKFRKEIRKKVNAEKRRLNPTKTMKATAKNQRKKNKLAKKKEKPLEFVECIYCGKMQQKNEIGLKHKRQCREKALAFQKEHSPI